MTSSATERTLVHSYLFLRRAIGFIGIALPFVLILGKIVLDGDGLLGSISGYYYSGMRDVYVGSMCGIGIFLLSYRGYGLIDDIATSIAAIGAIGLALFPTTPPDNVSSTDQVIGALHVAFATVFFLTLAFLCFALFTKTDSANPTQQKTRRNLLYRASGVTIVVCLILILVFNLFIQAPSLNPVLWLESIAILTFGLAWLTKGQAILADYR